MLDRSHNYGGTHFNRGLFRDHLVEMSPEHEIDLMTYRFTIVDDYEWEMAPQAYRLSMGSLNATNFAIENIIKSDISINASNEIEIEGYQAENIRANRLLFNLGYQHTLAGRHHIGARHTLTEEKSDLDATFFYRYGNFQKGMLELDFTVMDWAGNVVQDLAADSRNRYNKRYETTHHYSNSPELLSIKFVSPEIANLKAEFVGGVQTFSRKTVTQHADSMNFIDREWAHYLGGMFEYSRSHFTVGVTFQRTFSKLKRRPAPNSNYDLNFGNWQVTNTFGLFATGRLSFLRLEQWIWYGRNIDRLQGPKVPADLRPPQEARIPFNYVEKPLKLKSRLLYDPDVSGFKTGLEFHAEYVHPQGEKASNGVRNYDFRRVYNIIKDYNQRLTYTIGYRFSPHFYLLAGISYDLDKDKQSGIGLPKVTGTPTWFDGGFGRFTISW